MTFPFALRFFFILIVETVGDFVLFPFWWYTKGLVRTVRGIGRAIAERQQSLALLLWIANLFRPMYGQEDWQGKIISFVFRILILLWRLLLFFVWLALMGVVLFCYLALPLLALYGIVQNLK
ncbi:hypothetical protein HY625_00115 [Candidatus Uhrbacteria bacterium]|nr:hypothetical protein [Candidatus Uhrbacteria bacterium]